MFKRNCNFSLSENSNCGSITRHSILNSCLSASYLVQCKMKCASSSVVFISQIVQILSSTCILRNKPVFLSTILVNRPVSMRNGNIPNLIWANNDLACLGTYLTTYGSGMNSNLISLYNLYFGLFCTLFCHSMYIRSQHFS